MRKPRIATTPPKLTALVGRASPKGSHNFGGLNKGIDMPNKSAAGAGPSLSPLGGGGGAAPSPAMPTQDFCKGGKVISTRNM